uniref:Uncharacterized protein n=1 Tax=Caenorhabditis japonica TaxID=281687 RepID=A0A8R1EEJ3_CAEJA
MCFELIFLISYRVSAVFLLISYFLLTFNRYIGIIINIYCSLTPVVHQKSILLKDFGRLVHLRCISPNTGNSHLKKQMFHSEDDDETPMATISEHEENVLEEFFQLSSKRIDT